MISLRWFSWLAMGTAIVVSGCGGGSSATTAPPDPSSPGSVRTSVATTGPSAPLSFRVQVDDRGDRTIPANGDVLFEDLSPGQHKVTLNEVPPSCSVDGDNPRLVSVTSGREIATRFDVTCVATTGVIAIELVTTGEGSDPTGYTIVLDGGSRSEAFPSANGTARLADVPPGTHPVELADVAPNCVVQAPASRDVDVVAGDTANAGFAIVCAAPAPLSDRIIYISERDGRQAMWIINPDGSDPVELPVPVSGQGAAWPDISSDGSLIAYTNSGRTVVVQSDGNLVGQLASGYCPTWAPDDSHLAFAYSSSGPEQLWSMEADGSQRVRITPSSDAFEWEPDWSSSGKIAFVRAIDGFQRLWVMNADGTDLRAVTDEPVIDEGEPAWSPDGDYLLFSRTLGSGKPDIWVVGSDLQNPRNLTNSPATDAKGAWSPDGSRIVFESDRGNGDFDLYLINFDGSGLTRLTDDPGYDGDATWSP